MATGYILLASGLNAVSGLVGMCLKRRSTWGQGIATALVVTGCAIGLAGAAMAMGSDDVDAWPFPWPALGNATVGVDFLSAFFLIPVFLIGGLGSVYGLGYWPAGKHPGSARRLRLFWGLLVAGMAILIISRHAMAFLLGWELMALSAFFLVTTEDHRAEARRAGWLYLIATHVGTLSLFALFATWRWATGSYELRPLDPGAVGLGTLNVLFFLTLVAFGIKAGLIPLHFWLPGAHAAAPAVVSTILSGVVLKMGIYGLVRMLSLLPMPPPLWGGIILTLGAVSGLLGVMLAIGQHDLKRLLAYHSVENIGIILMGLGVAMLGRSAMRTEWIVLGLAGCLLHVWNHALFKSLLFLNAGAIVHATHTRQIDHLGGLAKLMPSTAALFLIGAVAICGLPPLNGFVSELLVYLGLFQPVVSGESSGSAVALAAPVLAMIGALAVACFVKVYGAVFLGIPRTAAARNAHESSATMRWPMIVIAACCVVIGLAPMLIVPLLDTVISDWLPKTVTSSESLGSLVPFNAISLMSVLLVVLIIALINVQTIRSRVANRVGTWDCGYAQPTRRMQYTASSFAQMIVCLFDRVLRPRVQRPAARELFPSSTKMHSHVDDPVLDRVLVPGTRRITRWLGWFRRFQQGLAQQYVLYILIAVILLFGTLIPFDDLLARLFAR